MNRGSITLWVFCSALFHALLIALLVLVRSGGKEVPYGAGVSIGVEVVEDVAGEEGAFPRMKEGGAATAAKRNLPKPPSPIREVLGDLPAGKEGMEGEKAASGETASGEVGSEGVLHPSSISFEGGSKVLLEIRKRIEASKRYPPLARERGIEGIVSLLFELNEDGGIKRVEIVRSSGQRILDEAAVEAVKAAQPFPYYPHPIRLAIRYLLHE